MNVFHRRSMTPAFVFLVCAVQASFGGLHAAVPVVESSSTADFGASRIRNDERVVTAAPVSAEASEGDAQSDRTGQLFYQVQLLQQEVLQLRGVVEELTHRVNRSSQEQKQRYLDVDRRLSMLSTSIPANGAAGASRPSGSYAGGSANQGGVGRPATVRPNGTGSSATTGNGMATPDPEEHAAYTEAFNLTRNREFDAAIAGFNGLLERFPAGTYAANSLYWLGELYLAQQEPDLELSRQSFALVVSNHPNHRKVPDSLYKLGVVYDRMGESGKALDYLQRVKQEYADSSAARLAESYARQLR